MNRKEGAMPRIKKGLTEEDKATRAFNTSQAAEYLSVTRKTMLKMCQEGTVQAIKIGSDWRISKVALDRLLLGEPIETKKEG